MKSVIFNNLPNVNSNSKKIAKYFLDSSRVRSTLFALLPTFVFFLKLIGFEADTQSLQNLIEVFSSIVGTLGSVYNLYISYKKGDIKFIK